MSHVVDHVDEVQLNAYLDRDLEFADPEVRKAVGAHIADCSKCSALLKEVRRVYKTASELLDVATPPARPAPSFDEIVKRATERQGEGSETNSEVSRFLRAQDKDASGTTGDFEVEIDDPIEDPVENDLLSMLQDESADDAVVSIEASAEEAGELVAGGDKDDRDTDTEERSLVVDEQPEVPEPAIPTEDEIVFVEAETAVEVDGPPPPPAVETPRKSSRGRGTRTFALAATIIVSVGIGGWFGRPYLMERFSNTAPVLAASENIGVAQRTGQAPSAGAARQEQQETAALGALADTRLPDADATPLPTDVPTEQDPVDATEGFADAERQEKADDVANRSTVAFRRAEGLASSMPGRTIVGNVRDATSKRAITGAQVGLVGTDRVARTDSQGRYEFANVPAGSVSVDVVGLGYERSAKGLAVSENEGAVADFELRRSAVALDEIVVAGAGPARAREAAANTPAPPIAETAWSATSRSLAETLLGGPLVAIDGSNIERIERAPGRAAIRITQTTRTGELVYLQIVSTGSIGNDATLESVEVTSSEEQRPSTGTAKYGNYVLTVRALVSGVELESLLRRITVAPEVN